MIGKDRAEQAREAGKLGGRPTNQLTRLKATARHRSQRLVAREQETSVRFLVMVRDNKVPGAKNIPMRERVRCAIELLDRGEMPAKSASYHGLGSMDEINELFAVPKLVITQKYGTEKLDEGNGEDVGGDS